MTGTKEFIYIYSVLILVNTREITDSQLQVPNLMHVQFLHQVPEIILKFLIKSNFNIKQ